MHKTSSNPQESDLEKRLRELVNQIDTAQVCNHEHFTDLILQAIKDAGYIKP